MNENPISITTLNDFVFCPASIYFHALYSDINKMTYYSTDQINGLNAHKSVDEGSYPLANTLKSLDVYCEKYNLIGKIDIYNKATKTLTERKKKVNVIYDGYVFQLYAQCFALREMGYQVEKMVVHSIDDNKNYPIVLPECNPEMLQKFETLINAINNFDLSNFIQTNGEKCGHCIYSPYCDRSVE